jgi:hypothetical protein
VQAIHPHGLRGKRISADIDHHGYADVPLGWKAILTSLSEPLLQGLNLIISQGKPILGRSSPSCVIGMCLYEAQGAGGTDDAGDLRLPFGYNAPLPACSGWIPQALAAHTIKAGILHFLSGTMALSDMALKDTAVMAIDDITQTLLRPQ